MTGMQRTLRYVAIPTEMAETVRSKGEDPAYRHPAHTQTATGHGPCRHCLRYFKVGKERRIMFTYDPFEGLEPLPLPGPIFIHEQPCPQYPTDGGFPEDLRGHPLTLIAYGAGRLVREKEQVRDGRVEPVLDRFFARSDVHYVDVRDTGAGCYDLRVERMNGTAMSSDVHSC